MREKYLEIGERIDLILKTRPNINNDRNEYNNGLIDRLNRQLEIERIRKEE